MARKPGSRPNRSVAKIGRRDRRNRKWMLLWAQLGHCAHCERPVRHDVDPLHDEAPSLDHLDCWAEGGKHPITNLLIKHRRCNAKRGSRPVTNRDAYWAAHVARRLAEAAAPRTWREALRMYAAWLQASRRLRDAQLVLGFEEREA